MTKRRTRGDGGLYQRHDDPTCPPAIDGERAEHKCRGRWVGTVDVLIDGKRRRKYVYGRTSREARVKLAEALRDKETGTLVVATMTTAAWLDHWLDHIAARSLRPQTLRGYRSKVERYIKPAIGRVRLTDLRPEHIRAMHDTMRRDGLAEASVRQAHAILKRALTIAVREGKMGTNPADRMESPTTETAKRPSLTLEQARLVLTAAHDDARWWLALFYGMRQGEALGLRWCDVDLTGRTIAIEQSLQTEDGAIIFGPPKSRSSRRRIPMLPPVEARLRLAHLDAGSPAADDESLIFTHDGAPIHPRRDWQAWRDLLAAAGVPAVSLHSARNTAASMLEAGRVPERLAMQILGHSQVQMTHRYQSADESRVTEALESVWMLLALE